MKTVMNPPVIEVSGLSFSYHDSPVLENVSLAIAEREFVAVIGPNGGGKTTLLKLLLGLLKPDRGTIRIFQGPPERAFGRIGYVPQNVGVNKSFPICVLDVVLMGRLRHPGGARISKKDLAAAQKALEDLDMYDYRNRRIDDLSGGQKERVFIARALATEPDILFLDEPTAGLDTSGRNDLYNRLKDLNQIKTILVVTHDMMVVSSHVTSVACVNRRLYYHGRPEVTKEMMEMGYPGPVEVIAHGVPRRILKTHKDSPDD